MTESTDTTAATKPHLYSGNHYYEGNPTLMMVAHNISRISSKYYGLSWYRHPHLPLPTPIIGPYTIETNSTPGATGTTAAEPTGSTAAASRAASAASFPAFVCATDRGPGTAAYIDSSNAATNTTG